MLHAFNALVKPQHEALKSALGVRTIPVIDESTVKKVEVYVTVKAKWGSTYRVKANYLKDFKALGLSI